MNYIEEYAKEICIDPQKDDVNPIIGMTIDMIPAQFTEDIDETIKRIKEQYTFIRNDAFLPATVRIEQCLFRLYELKYFVCAADGDVNFRGFAFDNAYHDFVMAKVAEKFDADFAGKEYEAALAFVKEKRYEEAGIHFKNAALNGHTAAQYNYGVSVSNGEVGEKDLLEGAFWYFQAAKKGSEKAMVNLAISYRNGQGVYPNGIMMLYWYAKAASIPFAYGVYNLGLCLANSEVLQGNEIIGRRLKMAAEDLNDERMRSFAVTIAGQVIDILREHTFNI